jgi:hypothetical protein
VRSVLRTLSGCLACLAVAGSAGQVHAQTVLDTLASPDSSFTYGNQLFTVSSCTYTVGGQTAGAVDCDGTALQNAAIVAGGIDRSGTTIEIAPASGSNIFASSGSQQTYDLAFDLAVAPSAASSGISSVTNGVSGTSQSANDQTLVSFAGSSTSPAFNIQSNLQSPSASFAWTPATTYPDTGNFNINLNVAGNPTSVLVLNSAELLFNTVPEPSSIAVLFAGIAALTVVRRKRVG